MVQFEQKNVEAQSQVVAEWNEKTAERVNAVAGIIANHLKHYAFEPRMIEAIEPTSILPFKSAILPANEKVLAQVFPGYREPTTELIADLKSYAGAKENYGTAPGEASALIVQLVEAIKPETAFVFGTARGRLEQLIARTSSVTEITTIDIPNELLEASQGKPDTNNIRYRNNIGIKDNSTIGDLFSNDPVIVNRVHQILGDSYSLNVGELAGTMRMIVVDGNHQFPNSLMDLANALSLSHNDGAVIVVDDFRKASPLNAGVEAAVSLFCQVTNLPALTPCPRPGEEGLQAAAAIIVVPSDLKGKEMLVEAIKDFSLRLKSFEK